MGSIRGVALVLSGCCLACGCARRAPDPGESQQGLITQLVNFDTLPGQNAVIPHGTPITDQYRSLGVLFGSDHGAAATVYNDPGEATSQPNILVGSDNFADIFIHFVDPTTLAPRAAENVRMEIISAGWNTAVVTARDAGGNALQSFSFSHPNGPQNGLANQDPLVFTVNGIYAVDFILQLNFGRIDGIGIDDLSFDLGPGAPSGARCRVDADCDSGVCRNGYCRAPSCFDGVKNGTETDVDCGGSCATKCDNQQGCASCADCRSEVCVAGRCVPPSCHDGIWNGGETDVDCGGPCPPCHDGQRCTTAADCRAGDGCSATHPKLNPQAYCRQPNPTCTNHAFDSQAGETAVDCGGPCKPCADGLGCAIGADCRSKVCTPSESGSHCAAPTCSDGEQNGDETGIDCGGHCGATCGQSQRCHGDGDCLSGTCIGRGDHRCCAAPLGVCTSGCGVLHFPPAPRVPGPGAGACTVLASGFSSVQGLTVGAHGELYVTDTSAGILYRMDPPLFTPVALVSGLGQPCDLMIDDNGDFVLDERHAGTLTRIPMIGGAPGVRQVIASGFISPWGVAKDHAGNFLVSNEDGTTVDRVAPSGAVTTGLIPGIHGPLELRFDSDGRLYVGEFDGSAFANGIHVFAYDYPIPGSPSLARTFSLANGPIGIAFDAAHDVYIANYGGNNIVRWAPDGSSTLFADCLTGPHGIAFDASGALYVANQGAGQVVRVRAP